MRRRGENYSDAILRPARGCAVEGATAAFGTPDLPSRFRTLGRQTATVLVVGEEMSARGLYRTKTRKGGAEYARVVYGIASPPGEIPRPLYEARECEPPFDTLPTKEEHEAARASNDTDIGEEAYKAIYNRLSEVGLLGPDDDRVD
jgi:hypothetical protein